jgi:hypothetical protein
VYSSNRYVPAGSLSVFSATNCQKPRGTSPLSTGSSSPPTWASDTSAPD